MTVFAIRWPSRAARRPAEQVEPEVTVEVGPSPFASIVVRPPTVVGTLGAPLPEVPPECYPPGAVALDLPPVVQPGPNGCTKRVTCRGRAGKDGRCAAHKETS